MGSYDDRLRRLVYQAWDLKKSPYYRDAIEAIVELYDSRLAEEPEPQVGALHPFALACLLRSIYAPTPGSTRQKGE